MNNKETTTMPNWKVLEDQARAEQFLRQCCQEGLTHRYGSAEVSAEVQARLNAELDQIVSSRLCTYFLMIWDICRYARSERIPYAPHGSTSGIMVGYLLGISNVDPLRYGLLFERFADLHEPGMPRVAIATSESGSGEINGYIMKKYRHLQRIIPLCERETFHESVLIANQPVGNILLHELPPLAQQPDTPPVAECGFLELQVEINQDMNVLHRCCMILKKKLGIMLDIENTDRPGERVLEEAAHLLIASTCRTKTGDIKKHLQKIQPRRVEELFALHALGQRGLSDRAALYARRKYGLDIPPAYHPLVDQILLETYQVSIFQEQTMQILHQLGGIDLTAAWRLVEAGCMKEVEQIAASKPHFVAGAIAKGMKEWLAEELYDYMLEQSMDTFSKGRSVQCAMTTLQLANVKVHYPEAFELAEAQCGCYVQGMQD